MEEVLKVRTPRLISSFLRLALKIRSLVAQFIQGLYYSRSCGVQLIVELLLHLGRRSAEINGLGRSCHKRLNNATCYDIDALSRLRILL